MNERTLARLLRLIGRKGGDVAKLFRPLGIAPGIDRFVRKEMPALTDVELRKLSSSAVVALANLQSQAAGRKPFRACDWRLLLFCLVNSASLGEAIRRAGDVFEAADGRMGMIELAPDDALVQVVIKGTRGDDEELALVVTLNTMVLFHEMFSWLVARPLGGECLLDFPERCRDYIDESLLPFDVTFDAPSPGFNVTAEQLELPIVRTIADCQPHMVNSLFAYAERSEPQELASQARRLVRSMLRDGGRLMSLDQLSETLGIGRVTLRRRLGAAGTSFQELRDGIRREFALELLERTDHAIEEVAVRLDFCDSDAFRSTFKSWAGMTPTEYRKTVRTDAHPA